jgi:diguanylate cyclase (GGDEF)-like protein
MEQKLDKVFISYSHRDVEWLNKLQTMLKPLVRTNTIISWDDTNIRPGDQWKTEIVEALATARVAVLLVSPNFLASDFITEQELPRILEASAEKGLKIIWIAISHSLYRETEIAKYQAANDPTKPLDFLPSSEQNRVLVNICDQIKHAIAQQPDYSPVEQILEHKSDDKNDKGEIAASIESMIADRHEMGDAASVIFMDVDGMSHINKRFGADVGDEVLKIVETVFSTIPRSRHIESYTTKWGEDEFISCINFTEQATIDLAEAIRTQIENYSWSDIAIDLHVTASFGVAQFNPNERTTDCLLRAIHGTFSAKKGGGNKIKKGPKVLPRHVSRNVEDYGS